MAAVDTEKLKGDKKIPSRILIKRMWKYVKSEWLSLFFALLIIVVGIGIDVLVPLLMRDITNNLQSESPELKIIIMLAVGYLVLSIVTYVLAYFQAMVLQKAGQRIVYKLSVFIDINLHAGNSLATHIVNCDNRLTLNTAHHNIHIVRSRIRVNIHVDSFFNISGFR